MSSAVLQEHVPGLVRATANCILEHASASVRMLHVPKPSFQLLLSVEAQACHHEERCGEASYAGL